MNNWKRFTRLSCPVCDGARKDCRQNLQSGLIHCRHTEANPIDYIFRGLDNLGFGLWAEKADAEEWTEAKREEWRQQREREKEAEKKRHQRSLSPSERDKEIRKILSQLTLSDSHRQQLKQRGFTDEQIEAANYRSVTQWQKLDFPVSNRLAGTNRQGLGLTTPDSGILSPIPDVNGLYVGFQLRRDNPDNGNKYVWLSSETKSTKLQNGELPLAVYKPSQVSDDGVVGLTEGTGFKPYRTCLRLGIPVIGAAGGNFSPEILKASLEELKAKLVILYADGGSLTNPNVLNQYKKVVDLLKSWGYKIDIAWWGQLQKSDGDIDEISNEKLQALAYLSVDEFLDKAPNKPATDKTISKNRWTFKKLVSQLTDLASRVKPVGFGKTSEPIEAVPVESKKYKKHDRIDTWINSSSKNLLDMSPTATGKSFDAGRLRPSMFDGEIDEIIYVSTDPRNVTTDTLKDWPVVEGRHNGLTYNSLGEIRRRKKNDQLLIVEPNCYRPKTLEVLASKNIKNATDKSLICKGCPQFEKCSLGVGRYNYLGQRRETLSQSRKVMHPSTLPNPSEHDYSRTLISWEESENSFNTTKTIGVTVADVKSVIVAISEDLELAGQWNPFLNQLKRLFEAKQPSLYGWTGQQLKDELRPLLPTDIDYDSLAALLKPDLSFLNPVAEYGENIDNLSPSARKRFSKKDDDLADLARDELQKDWLFNFIDALNGNGYLSMAYGEMTISYPDQRLKAIAQSAYKNIFLSATENPQSLEARLGQSVEVIECETESINNITFTQVTDLGKMGQQRGQQQIKRAKEIIEYERTTRGKENVAVIDFKRHSKDDPDALNHFVHSQGTNAVEGKTTLIIVGAPCPNLEALKHDYAVTYSFDPDTNKEDFDRYVEKKINSLITQENGRLRANRYPNREFEIIFLTNHDLSWLGEVSQVSAREITPDAEHKTERLKRLIREAVDQLMTEGKKVTQTAVSFLVGCSQQYISRFKKLLLLLIQSFKAKVVKIPDDPDPSPDLEYLGKTFLPLVEKEQLLDEFGSFLGIYSQSDWLILWEFIPDETRVSLLTQIFALCEVLS